MKMYKVRWTSAEGQPAESVVSYDLRSAETAKKQKEEAGLEDVEVVEDEALR